MRFRYWGLVGLGSKGARSAALGLQQGHRFSLALLLGAVTVLASRTRPSLQQLRGQPLIVRVVSPLTDAHVTSTSAPHQCPSMYLPQWSLTLI